jgi:hypothetical protein
MSKPEWLDDDGRGMQEAIAWALASARTGRPTDQLFPDEVSGHDWLTARIALDAINAELDSREVRA